MTAVLIVLAACVAAALLVTLGLSRRIEARHRPAGRAVAGIRLAEHGAADPTRPTVVLLHGANLQHDDPDIALASALAPLHVVAPDRPGHGWSVGTGLAGLSPEQQVARLRAAVAGVARGPVVLVGHSLGGMIALRWALDAPGEVAGLVLVNPTSHPRPGGLPWYQTLAEHVFGPAMAYTLVVPLVYPAMASTAARLFRPEPLPPDYPARTAFALALTPPRFLASMREYVTLRADLARMVPLYPRIAVPTVVVVGTLDPIVPPRVHGECLAAALPNATLMRLDGGGHMAHHAAAARIAAEVRRLVGGG